MSKYSLDAFMDATGAAGPLRLTVERAEAKERYVLPQPFALIGNEPRSDVRLADGTVAKRHAYLQVLGGRVLYVDLQPRTDGLKYPRNWWLDPGRVLQVGAVAVRLDEGDGAPGGGRHAHQLDPLPNVSLEIMGGGKKRARYGAKHHLVLIGYSSLCQIRLRDDAVSRFHCALVHTRTGLWVVDLLSRMGTAVNGVVARAARLDDGDELGVGAFVIRSRYDAADHAGPDPDGGAAADVEQPPADASRFVSLPTPPPAAGLPTVPARGALAPVPRPPDALELAESVLSPLVKYLHRVQQQMVDEFRTTVTEMFRGLHRDQMRLVRREMTKVRQLTEELVALKAELARTPAAPAREAPHAPAAPADVPRADTAPFFPVVEAPPPGPPDAVPAEPVGPVTAGTAAGRSAERPPTGRDTRAAEPPPEVAPEDIHALISQRIAALEREREGRWKRVLTFLGVTSGE
jgi:pSer/pThr/pTyr-binding forkhead associated (FHA) protein